MDKNFMEGLVCYFHSSANPLFAVRIHCESERISTANSLRILNSRIRESWIRGFANPHLNRVCSESTGSHACESLDSHCIGFANPREPHEVVGVAAQRMSIDPIQIPTFNSRFSESHKIMGFAFCESHGFVGFANSRFSLILANPYLGN